MVNGGEKLSNITRKIIWMKSLKVEYKKYIKLRIFATLIDYTIYVIVFCLYVYCFGTKTDTGGSEVEGMRALPIFVFWFLYFMGTEAINGATPGHDICGLTVVKANGEKITFGDAFKRRIVDCFEIVPYGIPALICINNTPKYQRIGDLWANTVVVK
jgi:uncharacterized RDD family membrane protein YckC